MADGGSITNLVITLLYKLFPEILEEQRLYRFYSPLYRITKGNKVYYYYSEEERLNGISGGEVERFKGIGGLEISDAKEIFFNPKWQRLEQLEWTSDCAQLIETLLGEDVLPRKKFVFENIDFIEYGEKI